MTKPHIILMNGTSSAGKTTLSKVLQKRLDGPYLHVCIDSFEDMMPERYDEGGAFSKNVVWKATLSGMHHSLAALARCGNNLIVDHVMIEGSEPANWVSECLTLLSPFDVLFVGVHCSLEELQRRERERGDRGIGLAEWQYSRMHLQIVYDLEVDTSANTTEECAAQIKAAIAHNSTRSAVAATLKRIKEKESG